ncbi:MAG: hypothetical protein IKH47_06075 [Bacteroidaceae bacterium]|nr:hypothetical protein [Bacteroidaceae bacterium]MBR4648834.1 hypothetical protein [Bacteroidaceae bacterium]
MKKTFVLFILSLCICIPSLSQIELQSEGVLKSKLIGGPTDNWIKLAYNPNGDYFAFVCRDREAHTIIYSVTLLLGTSPEEALSSLNNMLYAMDNGTKGEVFKVNEDIVMRLESKSKLGIIQGRINKSFIPRHHINKAIKFISKMNGENYTTKKPSINDMYE